MKESALMEMLDGIEMSRAITISESCAPVVVCPTRFVRELLYFRTRVPGWASKRDGRMCMRCLLGKHEECTVKACPCIHRVLEAEKMAGEIVSLKSRSA